MTNGIEYDLIYRGKTENGEWIESDFIMKFRPHPVSGKDKIHLWCAERGWTKIDKDTFGIYSGFNDKNGKKIFTDDIIKGKFDCIDEENTARILLLSGGIYYNENGSTFYQSIFDYDYGIWLDEFEIVGNVHDNKDLWEEKE